MVKTDFNAVTLYLNVAYPPTYPDEIPELSFEPVDEESGELTEEEEQHVLAQLRENVSTVLRGRFPTVQKVKLILLRPQNLSVWP